MTLRSSTRHEIKSVLKLKLLVKYRILLLVFSIIAVLSFGLLWLVFFCARSPGSGTDFRCPNLNNICNFFGVGCDDVRPVVNLAVVACGYKCNTEDAMNSLKSAVVFGRDVRLNVILFVDNSTKAILRQRMRRLSISAKKWGVDFNYRLQDSWFPPDNEKLWSKMFKPCASQRLFFPSVLPDMETVIYVDHDTLFLSSVKDLWDQFEIMRRENKMAALAPETELSGWYSLYSKIPYYGKWGLNSGVMLMNLTQFRQLNAEKDLRDIYVEYKGKFAAWADQDILNVYFKKYPQRLHQLSCEFNYRFHHCHCLIEGDCSCKAAIRNGISVLHGTSGTFHRNAYEFFLIIYNTFMNFNLDQEKPYMLANRLRKALGNPKANASNCSSLEFNDAFKRLSRYLGS